MHNRTAPTVPIELDKPRHLCMDFNAIAAIEEKTGRNLLKKGGWDDMSTRDLRAVIWACLLTEDPALTIEQVGAMIHMGNMEYLTGKFGELLQAAKGTGGSAEPERPTVTAQSS